MQYKDPDAVMVPQNSRDFSYAPLDADYVAPEMRAHLTLSGARPLTSSQFKAHERNGSGRNMIFT